jgi:hypothetical protein
MKETFYFSHDYTSRADEKIKQLLYETGMEGYGIYWAIIEDLYQNDNLLKCDFARLSYDYRCSSELVEKVILNFNLFKVDNNTFSSISIQKRLELRESKSLKAKQSAQKRWGSNANSNANASKSHNGRNAIKESKGKEIKLNIDSSKLLSLFNSILGKKAKVISEKAKKQLKERLKEGYTKEDIVNALRNAAKDQHHLDTNYKYLTLEFITRPDKLERFVNMGDFKTKTQIL